MRSRLLLLLFVVAAIAASCSGTQPMLLEEYAAVMTETTDSYVLESQEISFRYQRAVEDQVSALLSSGSLADLEGAMTIVRSETVNFLALLDDAMGRYHTSLTEFTAPEKVAGQHEAYLEIIASVRSTLPASRDALADTKTFEEVIASLVGSGFADGQAAWTAACESLESAIRGEGRGANLKCVREQIGS
jgi:hypothetical protein